jgi:DNA-directed RNA polymerase specialized sigma24 family protein
MNPSKTTTSRSSVTDADIRPYIPTVESHATRLAGTRRARRAGVEYDDLYQEGLMTVLLSLRRGVNPMPVIANRMKDWIRLQIRQKEGDPIPYETLLPTEAPDDGAGDVPA